jgi:allene oxide cyclase
MVLRSPVVVSVVINLRPSLTARSGFVKNISRLGAYSICGVLFAGMLLVNPGIGIAGGPNYRAISIYDRATGETSIDLGAPGDSQGDVIAFDDPSFDPVTHVRVGNSRGQCVRTVVGVAYECVWTTTLPQGSLMVAGPYYDAAPSTLAIIGGTGAYRNARGEVLLRARPVNNGVNETDLTFRITWPD